MEGGDKVLTDIRMLPSISDLGLTDANIVQINSSRSVGVVMKPKSWIILMRGFSRSISLLVRIRNFRPHAHILVQM